MASQAKAGRTAEIQDRDLLILRGLYESRLMTAEHVSAIYFEGRYEAARKRLQKLKAAGYVGERPRRVYDPAVLFLTRKAFEALCESGTIADLPQMSWIRLEKRVRVSSFTLQHELEVQDVRAALIPAVEKTGRKVVEFSTWPVMFQFFAPTPSGQNVRVDPDGYIHVYETEGDETYEYRFFLEVDRSTEVHTILGERAACYRNYYQRGGLASRLGQPRDEYEAFPFRVLMIFRTAERRNNTAVEMLTGVRPAIETMTWMTTMTEFLAEPLGQIWMRPRDYRDATRGTAFDPQRPRDDGAYRRQPEREAFVEETVQKQPLFDDQPPKSA
jgi:hypothetical protein